MPLTTSLAGASTRGFGGLITFGVPIDFDSIATTVVGSGGVSSVTFSNIPQTYKHLQVRIISNSNSDGLVQFNSNTSSSYNRSRLFASGTSVSSSYALSATSMSIVSQVSTGNVFSPTVLDIVDYTSTNKHKTVMSFTGYATTGSKDVSVYSGVWSNNSAITSITFSGGTIARYSHFALYGIRG